MSLLRNPEIKKSISIYLLCATIAAVIGTILDGFFLGIAVFFAIFFGCILHLYFSYQRYEEIACLASQLDEILHGSRIRMISDEEEGELSILKNEIGKMTARLWQQAEDLQKEKIFLADSIADISHQLRTPLTSLALIVSFLSEPDITKERHMELLRELKILLKRMEWLINTLLKISKLDAGTIHLQKENINVKELLKKAYEPLAIPMELRNVILKTEVKESATFKGDFSWTLEAVENVMKNCMEHTPEGGTISVKVEDNNIYLGIMIEDSGKGVDKEDLPHIFERFYKGKNAGKDSVGIGLALAKVIVVSQNGTITAKNREEGGTKFEIRFYRGIV